MDLKKYLLFTLVGLIFSVAYANDEQNDANAILDIIPAPADCSVFANIDQVAVLCDSPEAGFDKRVVALLKNQAKQQLISASIESAQNVEFASATLNLQLELLPTLEPDNCVYRLQLHLKRNALLDSIDTRTACTVWSSQPLLAAIAKNDSQARLEKALNEQMKALIAAIHMCKEEEQEKEPLPRTAIPEKTPQKKREPKRDDNKKTFVASKNSTVFHKPECTSVARIKETNVIHYGTREEAANDGKRPCKSCNP